MDVIIKNTGHSLVSNLGKRTLYSTISTYMRIFVVQFHSDNNVFVFKKYCHVVNYININKIISKMYNSTNARQPLPHGNIDSLHRDPLADKEIGTWNSEIAYRPIQQ